MRATRLGITIEKALEIMSSGVCAICGSDGSDNEKGLAIDHNHKTGEVRDLLCVKCNTGLGAFGDDVELLERAIWYLRYWTPQVEEFA
jgi:hypothetical protein